MQGRMVLFKILTVFLVLSCTPAEEQVGRVVKVIDGDTFDLLTKSNQKIRVRLFGIDAPERGQTFNVKAKEYTASLLAGKDVRLVVNRKDQYGRIVADVYLTDGTHVNAQIIKAGFAWHYKTYNDDPALAQLEIEARKKRIGLWQDAHPQPPWEYRKQKRKAD